MGEGKLIRINKARKKGGFRMAWWFKFLYVPGLRMSVMLMAPFGFEPNRDMVRYYIQLATIHWKRNGLLRWYTWT
jgi:hypothetical protein